MKKTTTRPNFSRLSVWSTTQWDSYARGFLDARGIFDPAGRIWLSRLLQRFGPAFEKVDPEKRTLRSIHDAVAAHFEQRDVEEESHSESTSSRYPVVTKEDVTWDGTPGPVWLKVVSQSIWDYGAPHRGRRLQYPAIPEVVVEPLAAILAGRADVGANGQMRVNGEVVGVFTSDRRLAEALGTVAAHRVLRYVVGHAWVFAVERIEPPDEVVVAGGWTSLARALGLESRSAAQDLQRAGEALAALKLETPLGSEKVFAVRRSRRDNQTTLTLVAKGPLAVDYTGRLRKAKKPDRLLVPIRPDIPVLTPQRSTHAQQLSFEMLLMREFRRRLSDTSAETPLRLGHWNPRLSAQLTDEVIDAAAGTAGLSRKNVDAVLAIWRDTGARGGWIARAAPGATAHVLHCSSELMETFLLDGLSMTQRGRALGTRSGRSRAAAIGTTRPK